MTFIDRAIHVCKNGCVPNDSVFWIIRDAAVLICRAYTLVKGQHCSANQPPTL